MRRENSRITRLIRRPKDRNRTEKVNMEGRSHKEAGGQKEDGGHKEDGGYNRGRRS